MDILNGTFLGVSLYLPYNLTPGAAPPSLRPTDKSRLISNMFSEDIRFAHYNLIVKEIEKEIKLGLQG